MIESGLLELSHMEFELIQSLLIEESGLYFDREHQRALPGALSERMRLRRFRSVEEYYHFLRFHPDGRQDLRLLIESLTVGETYFFRNQPQFAVLREHLLPAIVSERPHNWKRVNIWSAACSTGEEPYSIAMTLLETLPQPETWQISILATDINREHLSRAQQAVYGPRAVRNVSPPWLDRYFQQRGDKFHLREIVKNMVRFECHNLAKDPYALPGMQDVDFLFCRNVTIYFTLEITRRVMDQFARSLAPTGTLFIGDAETLWQISDKFEAVEFPHTFLYRHASSAHSRSRSPVLAVPEPLAVLPPPAITSVPTPTTIPAAQIAPPSRGTNQSASPPLSRSADPQCDLGLEAVRRKDYQQALTHFETALQENPHHVRAHLGKASLLADQGNHEQAIAELREVVRSDNLAAEAYYLLGTLDCKLGRFHAAIEAFRRLIYADPTVALAYFALADVLRSQGRFAKARREYQNAIRSVEGKPGEELVRFSEDITCDYLRSACEKSINQLANA